MRCSFREEIVGGSNVVRAVFSTLYFAGHVVLLSGTTLTVIFVVRSACISFAFVRNQVCLLVSFLGYFACLFCPEVAQGMCCCRC